MDATASYVTRRNCQPALPLPHDALGSSEETKRLRHDAEIMGLMR